MIRIAARLLAGPPATAAAMALLLLVVGGLPLVFVPWAFDSFVLTKECLFGAATALLIACVAIGAASGAPFRVAVTPVNALALGLVAWMSVSILWSNAPDLSVEEAARTAMLVAFLLVTQSVVAGDRRRLLAVGAAFLLSTVVVAAWLVTQDFRAAFAPGSIAVRAVLGDWRDALSQVALGNTSHIADFLALGFLGWLGALVVARSRGRKALCIAALWLHSAALIACWSVHSNLSLIVGAVVFAYLMRDHVEFSFIRRRMRSLVVLVLGWIVVVGFYVADHPANPHGSAVWAPRAAQEFAAAGVAPPEGGFRGGIFAQAFASPRWIAGLDTRKAIWLNTLEVVRTNSWFGAGAGTFTWMYPAAITRLVADDPRLAQYSGTWTNAAHNEALQFWAELGIVGVMLLVLLVAVPIKAAVGRLREGPPLGNAAVLSAGAAMLAAQVVQMQMNFPLQLPVSSMLFLLLAALPFALPSRGAETIDLQVPVEREIGPVTIGVLMKNMAFPSEASVFVPGAVGRGVVVVGALALCGWLGWRAMVPLRADLEFRKMRDAREMARAGIPVGGPDAVYTRAQRALVIWPGHVDCRSTYQEALLEGGRLEDVVAQTPLVLRKLNAIEVYRRRAMALEALGRGTEAVPDWDEIFRRRPDIGEFHPAQFAAWLLREEARAGKTSP